MNTLLFKVYKKAPRATQKRVFDSVEIMTTERLRDFFKHELKAGRLDPDCYRLYGAEIKNGVDNVDEMYLEDIVNALIDNNRYHKCAFCYFVEEIFLTEPKKKTLLERIQYVFKRTN